MRHLSNRTDATSDELIEEAEEAGYEVVSADLRENGSCSVMLEDGECVIGLDAGRHTEPERRVMIAHELGHCITGSFYNIYAVDDVRGKHERRADEWAVRRLIPRRAFLRAVRRGAREAWQIAEEFGVTVRFAEKAARVWNRRLA